MRVWNRFQGWRHTRRLAGPRILKAFADAFPEASFVEIGSNDGEKHDHLRPLILSQEWRGIMVEPVPYVFDRLRHNYGHLDRVTLANVAIAERDGKLPFFYLPQVEDHALEGLPEWYDAIGSFSLKAVLGHRGHIPDIETRIVRTEVDCLTLESLLSRCGMDTVDLILVDTEGHDATIVRRIDFTAMRPHLLVYEHFHLAADERAALRTHLDDAGYLTMEEHFDTFAVRRDTSPRLLRVWGRSRPGLPGISAADEGR